jgi:aspartyl-tRNA(Asn)/glutamyl-tRNA(Gln) amidotransferase subunit A
MPPSEISPIYNAEGNVVMQATDVSHLSLSEAGALIQARSVSPLELTEEFLRRIERLNPWINAYVEVTAERARADARAATDEIARGSYRGKLHGVPIGLKDLYDTAGIRTAGGTKILAERVPNTDSTVARKLREAGSVLLGKLNTHEFAFGVTTNNPHFGATHNPWNLDSIPGGSSGGSAAAIAAGLATATTGTDTGGSIRIPASLCGCVGLKPTYGRVSKAGVLPLSWLLDNTGPITRTVEDAAVMLQAMAGYDPDDFSTVPVPVEDYVSALAAGVRGLRLGVPRAYFYDRLDDDVRAAIDQALDVLRGQGAELRDVEVPDFGPITLPAFGVVVAELLELYGDQFRTRPEDFGADVAGILQQGAPDGVSVAAVLRMMYELTHTMRRVLTEVDALVTPTTPVPATLIGQDVVEYGGAQEPVIFAMIRCTFPFNATRLPALSVPCGFTRANLPIGLQIAGRPFDEATVLRIGHAYQLATDWHLRQPPDLM